MYVDSGMEAMTTANAVEALSSWPSRNHTDGYFLQKCSPVPRNISLDAEIGGCGVLIDNLHQWMKKCARQKRAIVRTIEIEVVSSPPTVHFSEACVARGWTVTEPTTPVSLLRVVVARVCDA